MRGPRMVSVTAPSWREGRLTSVPGWHQADGAPDRWSDMTTDTTGRVTVTLTGAVADVRLNRPEKRNALDPAMFEALVAAGERLKCQQGLRAVVLSGQGPDFCAGKARKVMPARRRETARVRRVTPSAITRSLRFEYPKMRPPRGAGDSR